MGPQTCQPEAPAECPLCPRLVRYRQENKAKEPAWFNGAVPSFGDVDCRLLIVGLAPGRSGANRTGRPFTGDYAGELLYSTLLTFGFARGRYLASPDDGLELTGCLISNAVRCAPPENKPTPEEINTCRAFLVARLASLPRLKAIVALGRIAHESVIVAVGAKRAQFKFAHGARHVLPGGTMLFDSFHCSRYNTNTGRLTEAMFHDVFRSASEYLKA